MEHRGIRLDGYPVVRLTPADAADLQDLFERCTDFHELSEGGPTRSTAGAEELVARPAGKELADKFSFGIYAPAGGLVGFLDLMRDYPAESEWWIGLLMLDPAVRGGGLGGRIYRAAAEWVSAQGGAMIRIGVLEQNPDAMRFWQRQGFLELRREPHVSDTGHRSRLVVMSHPCRAAGPG
jgi:GNAT superfamily N-acetyltransferase